MGRKTRRDLMVATRWKGRQLTRGKIKNAVGGLRPAKAAAARKPAKVAAARQTVSKRSRQP